MKKAGHVRHLGFSSHASVETLTKMADHHPWNFAQRQLNYFDWQYGNTEKEYKVLEERNIPIMVIEPVRGGRLATLSSEAEEMLKTAHPDWSMASWALSWVKRLPQVQVILSGMSSIGQIQENIKTFQEPEGLNDADTELLMRACEAFKKQVSVYYFRHIRILPAGNLSCHNNPALCARTSQAALESESPFQAVIQNTVRD